MALIYVACYVVLFMNRQTVLNSYGIQTSFSKKNGFRQRCATQKVKHELGDDLVGISLECMYGA